jgi:hypothetical protein
MGVSFNGGGWLLSTTFSGHTSWPLTPLISNTEAPPGDILSDPSIAQTVGVRNSVRHGYYYTVDLKAARNFRLQSGSLELSVNLANITDRKNLCCDDVEFADLGGGIEDIGITKWQDRKYWQPFFPYASIVWEF